FHLIAKPETFRAGSEGIVKGKAPWLDLLNADPAVRAGKTLAEIQRFPADHIHHKQAFRKMKHTLHRISQPFLNARIHHTTVHNDLYIMFDIFIQRNFLRQLIHIAVHSHAHIAAALRTLEQLSMSALTPSYHRGEKLDPCPFRERHDLVHHLVHRLLHDLTPT